MMLHPLQTQRPDHLVTFERLDVSGFVVCIARRPHGVHNLGPLLTEPSQNRGMRLMLGFVMVIVGSRPPGPTQAGHGPIIECAPQPFVTCVPSQYGAPFATGAGNRGPPRQLREVARGRKPFGFLRTIRASCCHEVRDETRLDP
jgi:hypothetical protein